MHHVTVPGLAPGAFMPVTFRRPKNCLVRYFYGFQGDEASDYGTGNFRHLPPDGRSTLQKVNLAATFAAAPFRGQHERLAFHSLLR